MRSTPLHRYAAWPIAWPIAWLCAWLCLCGVFATAQEPTPQAGPAPQDFPRTVLHVYDSRESPLLEHFTHYHAEIVFQHLGLHVRHWDLRCGRLPAAADMVGVRAVFTWFTDDQMPDPAGWIRWLLEQQRQGRRCITWGSLGCTSDDQGLGVDEGLVNELLASWGVQTFQDSASRPFYQVESVDERYFNFERRYIPGLKDSFFKLKPLPQARLQPVLSLRYRTMAGGSTLVCALHPQGGFCLMPDIHYTSTRPVNFQWFINPFSFLAAAAGLPPDMPRPDTTTINGRRIYYSQIDGDSSTTLTLINGRQLNAEYLYENFLRQLDLPVSVGAVEGEVALAHTLPWIGPGQRLQDCFRAIYALDQVEAASHGCAHPLHWERGLAAIKVPGLSRAPINPAEQSFLKDSPFPDSYLFHIPRPDWLKREIISSSDYVNTLLPSGRRCRLFQWTGNSVAQEDALALVEDHGLVAINGGFFGIKCTDTVMGIPPDLRTEGSRTQVYASAPNENFFTEEWTANFNGFIGLIPFLERTGHPHRLKPIDVYYHFYSAERPASYQALLDITAWCRKQAIAPVFPSEFIAIALDAPQLKLQRDADGSWLWTGGRHCRTLRLEGLHDLDLARSSGLLGFYQDASLHCTYLHLDGSGRGQLAFGKTPADGSTPWLHSASCRIDGWQQQGKSLKMTLISRGRPAVILHGLPPLGKVRWQCGAKEGTVTAAATGTLSWDAAIPHFGPLTLALDWSSPVQ